ncbi:Serine O-succinyltransferase [Savitreella phatthalungensis]
MIRRNIARAYSIRPANRRRLTTGTNAALAFPCVDASEERTQEYANSLTSGPEPQYTASPAGVRLYTSAHPLACDYGGKLDQFDVAFETWGSLSPRKDNVILLSTGLSASSHARSTAENPAPGWWENYIGPGLPLDTDKFFVVCANVIGGCFGSTGPSSKDPADGKPYATRFPIVTIFDMVRAQFRMLESLGIQEIFASVGSSMGGMQSLATAVLYPDRVRNVVSISGCAKSHPYSIALRHTQRQIIMADPNWQRGFYYDKILPHHGMKLARQIATISYRSGPEWEVRFGNRRADDARSPAFCPDFLIETYLDHAGEKFIGTYDPNSLLYVSKAMDMFDLSRSYQDRLADLQTRGGFSEQPDLTRTLAYDEKQGRGDGSREMEDLIAGVAAMRRIPTLVIGVQSDNLMPVSCQREVADAIKGTGNEDVQYSELSLQQSWFGHDTFLLSKDVGRYVREFLSRRAR